MKLKEILLEVEKYIDPKIIESQKHFQELENRLKEIREEVYNGDEFLVVEHAEILCKIKQVNVNIGVYTYLREWCRLNSEVDVISVVKMLEDFRQDDLRDYKKYQDLLRQGDDSKADLLWKYWRRSVIHGTLIVEIKDLACSDRDRYNTPLGTAWEEYVERHKGER